MIREIFIAKKPQGGMSPIWRLRKPENALDKGNRRIEYARFVPGETADEMLEALKKMREVFQVRGVMNCSTKQVADAVGSMNDAIDKAKGRNDD